MIEPVRLQPVPMSVALLEDLERRGLILRLAPGRHRLPVADGESAFRSLYESDERWGPHKLIAVTVDRRMTARLDVHPDNEEFLLIGDPAARPLYLVIALAAGSELVRRAAACALSPSDFICLHVAWNDAEFSFFTMLAGTPHVELAGAGEGVPPSFYVTESRDLPTESVDLAGYELGVG